mmetsp:Transcript_48800/g.87889  ORF Transcript_48800/g.87889 Transcript_48800/m.87889 type:complete len:103 (+) Transcript_48800:897-1205(+)
MPLGVPGWAPAGVEGILKAGVDGFLPAGVPGMAGVPGTPKPEGVMGAACPAPPWLWKLGPLSKAAGVLGALIPGEADGMGGEAARRASTGVCGIFIPGRASG